MIRRTGDIWRNARTSTVGFRRGIYLQLGRKALAAIHIGGTEKLMVRVANK